MQGAFVMLNTQIVSNASDQDLVVIDIVFHDDTFTTAGPLPRWRARMEMKNFRNAPFPTNNKWVRQATIWEYQAEVPFDSSKPVH
jgi:hypothetical protein